MIRGGEVYYSLDPLSAFDVNGSLLREQYGNGIASEYGYYPNSHRLQDKRVFLGSTNYLQRSYTYDQSSNITQINDPLNLQGTGALRSASYDNLDRLVNYTYQGAARSASLTYDSRGNILQNSESFGTSNYEYTSSRPHAVTRIGTNSYDYDANGNMISDPNRRMSYNAANQMTRVEMTSGVAVDYEYDYTGARVKKTSATPDLYHRVTRATTHYLGDAVEIRGDQVILNIFAGQRKVAVRTLGSVSGIAAAGGSLEDRGIDPEMSPTLVMPYLFLFFTLFLLGSLRPWPVVVFPLLASDLSPALSLARRGGSYCYHFWLSWCALFQETLGHFPKRRYAKSFTLFLLALFLFQPMSWLYADDGEPPFPTSDTDYFYYIHDDHLGSSAVLTEGKTTARHSGITYRRGEILQRFEYAPFGRESFVLNPNLKLDPSYTGQRYDVETGLYFYQSRYYDPLLGRFIQPDTVVPDAKNLQTYNRYTYVNNNPLKYIDPTGHSFWSWFKKLFAAFIGAFLAVVTGFALAPLSIGIWAGVIAGAVGGLVSGAITGGLKGALLGGLFGAIGGLAFGGANLGLDKLGLHNQWGRFAVMAGVGAAVSGATGGWQGLVVFGAGLAGAAAGMGVGKAIAGGKATAKLEGKNDELKFRPGKAHFDYSDGQRFPGLRAKLGPDAGPLMAGGGGLDVTAGGGAGVLWGGRASLAVGGVYDVGTDAFYAYGTTEGGSSTVSFGGSVGGGIEGSFYTGDIGQFAGSTNTLNINIGPYSLTVTPGSNGGTFFTFGTLGAGTGFEISVIPSHTIIKPLFR